MITAIHTLIYSEDPDATRAFLRDVIGWPFVDAHEGWLIFGTGPSEMGVHPPYHEDGGERHSVPAPHPRTAALPSPPGPPAPHPRPPPCPLRAPGGARGRPVGGELRGGAVWCF